MVNRFLSPVLPILTLASCAAVTVTASSAPPPPSAAPRQIVSSPTPAPSPAPPAPSVQIAGEAPVQTPVQAPAGSSGASSGAPRCIARGDALALLRDAYGESRTGYGLRSRDEVVEMFVSPETGSWTIVVTRTDGLTCLVASGARWERTSPPAPGRGA